MSKLAQQLNRLDVGARIAAISFVLNALIFGLFIGATDYFTSKISAAAVGLIVLLVLAAIQHALIHSTISRPLAMATQAASKFAAGDLTTRIDTSRQDDIGQLLKAINGIGQGLANVIWNIRNGTETLAAATSEIAAGNHDLALRTEQ